MLIYGKTLDFLALNVYTKIGEASQKLLKPVTLVSLLVNFRESNNSIMTALNLSYRLNAFLFSKDSAI